MKILIVDDNAAIQEILSEILSVDGYETCSASSVEDAADAVERFRPDAVLLDSQVGDRNGLDLIDMMLAKGIQMSNVLVLTASGDQAPKDNNAIAGFVPKPFKSTEVLEKVRSLFADETAREKPRKSLFRSIFGKKEEDHKETEDRGEAGLGLKFGTSYLFVEEGSDNAYRASAFFNETGCQVMIVTSGKIKAAIERMNDDDVKVIALSGKDGPDYVEPEMIGTLMGMISDFTVSMEKPVIMMDDLDLLIDRNGLNSVLTMIHQVINNDSGKKLTLISSAASANMTEKDRELLLHSMEIKIFG